MGKKYDPKIVLKDILTGADIGGRFVFSDYIVGEDFRVRFEVDKIPYILGWDPEGSILYFKCMQCRDIPPDLADKVNNSIGERLPHAFKKQNQKYLMRVYQPEIWMCVQLVEVCLSDLIANGLENLLVGAGVDKEQIVASYTGSPRTIAYEVIPKVTEQVVDKKEAIEQEATERINEEQFLHDQESYILQEIEAEQEKNEEKKLVMTVTYSNGEGILSLGKIKRDNKFVESIQDKIFEVWPNVDITGNTVRSKKYENIDYTGFIQLCKQD